MSRPRVIFLSSSDHGVELLRWLESLQSCDIVQTETENRQITKFTKYDLGISFLYVHKIPASEFVAPYRWVNFHPAPLPEYRGRNLAYQAILEGSREFGGTLHYMDATFDTGEVIEVARFPIEASDTAGDILERSKTTLCQLFHKWIPSLLLGRVPSHTQQGGRYYRKTEIDDRIPLTVEQERRVRALTAAPLFFPRVSISGRTFRIVPEPIQGETAQ